MPTLHTVNKSPFERNSLETCLSIAQDDASILLIEDAVVAVTQNSTFSTKLEEALDRGIKLFALKPDIVARGLPEDRIMSKITLVEYDGFVQLSCDNDRVQNWL